MLALLGTSVVLWVLALLFKLRVTGFFQNVLMRRFPPLATGMPPAASDHDGKPDAWEHTRGLEPRDPSNAAADRDGDGYTNIKDYLLPLLMSPEMGSRAD
jgi:hypothetical protein